MTGVVWDWKLLVLIAEYWSFILSEYMYVHSNNQIQNRYSSCMSLVMVKNKKLMEPISKYPLVLHPKSGQ